MRLYTILLQQHTLLSGRLQRQTHITYIYIHGAIIIMMDQDEFLMRTSDQTEEGLESSNATFLEDAAQNADLYIANQNVSMQI